MQDINQQIKSEQQLINQDDMLLHSDPNINYALNNPPEFSFRNV